MNEKIASTILSSGERACVFTGHRDLGEAFYSEALLEAVRERIDAGVKIFLNGGARGFDLLAAEFVLSLQFEFPEIKLVVCVPCEGQDKYFSEEDKQRYRAVVSCADEVLTLSEHYFRGCMQTRDRFMADRADEMIAYCKKREGGTAYTVRYFQKRKPEAPVFFL